MCEQTGGLSVSEHSSVSVSGCGVCVSRRVDSLCVNEYCSVLVSGCVVCVNRRVD